MPNKISNLEELRREKELLRLKMKITRQAFFSSLGQNRRHAQRLLVNKIALPIGAGALVSWLVQALAAKTKDDVEMMGEAPLVEEQAAKYWWTPLVRTLLRFLQAYLDQVDPVETPQSDNGQDFSPVPRREKEA